MRAPPPTHPTLLHTRPKHHNKPINKPTTKQQTNADWGFATFFHPGTPLTALAGTCYYVAPEVLRGSYDERADVWSCGATLFVLLSGTPPFFAVRDEDVFKKILDDGVPNM